MGVMATPKKILVPVDFSAHSASAALYAKKLAGRFQAQVVILHALPPFPVPELLDMKEIMDGCRARGRMRLDAMFADNGFRPNRVLLEGDPATVIVDYARRENVDLIVMPAAGAGNHHRSLPGPVAAHTLCDAPCPVWTTNQVFSSNGHGPKPELPENIVCALDLESHSAGVLDWAAGMAETFGARLTVVHALAGSSGHPEVYYLEADLRKYLADRARREISELLRRTERPSAEIAIEPGPATNVVRSLAEDRHAHLLVIGRGSQTGGAGSSLNACSLISQVHCPVLAV